MHQYFFGEYKVTFYNIHTKNGGGYNSSSFFKFAAHIIY